MKIGIVANGPSGSNCGKEIDACDFVVRMQRWGSTGPLNSGRRVSAIAGMNSYTEIPEDLKNDSSWEFWATIPVEYAKFPADDWNPLDVKWIVETNKLRRPIKFASFKSINKAVDYLRLNLITKKEARITMGIACLVMAVDLKPEEIQIWGYDKVFYNTPGSQYAQCPDQDDQEKSIHDFPAEKKLIAEFADKGLWLGEPVSTKLIWHGRPNIDFYSLEKKVCRAS